MDFLHRSTKIPQIRILRITIINLHLIPRLILRRAIPIFQFPILIKPIRQITIGHTIILSITKHHILPHFGRITMIIIIISFIKTSQRFITIPELHIMIKPPFQQSRFHSRLRRIIRLQAVFIYTSLLGI